MSTIIAAIRDIGGATHEQSVATTEMARAAEEVNQLTMKNDQAVQGASQTVIELSALSAGTKWWGASSSECGTTASVDRPVL